MKTKKRKLVPPLVSLCLCLGLLSAVSASAAEVGYEVTGGKIYFDASTGTITRSDASVTEAAIPSEIYGVPVTAIGPYAFYQTGAAGGSRLERITIPNSVTAIGRNAFYGCSALTSIVIPDSVTSVDQDAFSGCTGLSSVTIGRGMTSIPRTMFSNASSLTSITIPENITSIGFEAFYSSGLTSVTIPSSVTSIGDAAFGSCRNLKSVYIPDSVTQLGACAFQGCTSLTDLRLSNSLTTLPRSVFESCSLESVVIPKGVQSLDSAFRFCGKLKSVTIPASVTSIGSAAFYNCKALSDVYYGAGVAEWSQIKMGTLNDGLDQATLHFSEPVAGFHDVTTADYYADAVAWAKESGVTAGTNAEGTAFSPTATVTRAEAVTFLWRAAGKPEPSSAVSPFSDVTDPGAYYYKAVLWAAEQGITNGNGGTGFGLNDTLAYDQILTFLCRAAGGSAGGSDWSAAAVNWAQESGLTNGLAFTAKADCPRADVVYCLWKQLA